MARRIVAFLRSLEIRLLVPLSITVAAVLAIHSFLNYRSTQGHFFGLVRADVERSSGLIKKATHDGMLLNRLNEVQVTIERLAEQPEVAAIRVYDKHGTIILSASTDERGQMIAIDSDTCHSCHGEDETKDSAVLERSSLTRVPGGPEVLRHLTVIENDESCSTAACHFHPADQRVLGVLDVEMSMQPLEAVIGTTQRQLIWTTIVLILISGAVAAVFIRRVVHRPAVQLYQGTRRIAAGDLDTRIEVRGDHELARLAEAFNRMVYDLREARREVTEWSQKLEDKVEEKRQELKNAQRQVLHMEKMASLGKLSATVAHELNNPISGMLTYARLIRRELDDQSLPDAVRQEINRYLGVMDKECTRCGAIIHNMLTFARTTGSEMTQVDINEIVERSLMLVRHHLEISNVRLTSEPLMGNSILTADADQLQQALIALLVNAIEAMEHVEEAQAELDVRLRGDADTIDIEVRDSGIGIDPQVLPHIFEPFYSTKGGESGVGLGLAVVYGIVNRHGGTITVDSKAGSGTTFHLSLPRTQSERPNDDTDRPESRPVLLA
ncbi:MAG: HAMP domain-containing protein [Planctomycetes bacterium]|nr:HAMP domain-containing protein [Planctomycetota bacterium]